MADRRVRIDVETIRGPHGTEPSPVPDRHPGELAEPLVGPLEGMTVEDPGDESVLTGDLVDQAQLQGVLSWLTTLGVEIVSVNPADDQVSDDQRVAPIEKGTSMATTTKSPPRFPIRTSLS